MGDIKIVIGSNFGDEGKGLITDYFSYQYPKGIVVRFNGGSQAGHTVVTPNNIRHIFSHFGSGTLCNLPTYLSSFYVVNPMIFKKEYNDLYNKGFKPKVFIDKNCCITTPFEMILNQIVENSRGINRHGSCGLGINETIQRSCFLPFTYEDLSNQDVIFDKLVDIKEKYLLNRLEELSICNIPEGYLDLLNNNNIIKNYLNDITFMLNHSKEKDISILNEYDDIIFEGAQGLLLDQNSKYFPNVTPSNTGMQNVQFLLKSLNDTNKDIEIIYVTRSYMTKHGAGLFGAEVETKPYQNIVDLTNVENPHQGKLRYGILDIDLLKESIEEDIKKYTDGIKYSKSIAISCMDQIDNEAIYICNGKKIIKNTCNLIKDVMSNLCPNNIYLSYSNNRNGISKYI
jgi:adenylosuccinate synthase